MNDLVQSHFANEIQYFLYTQSKVLSSPVTCAPCANLFIYNFWTLGRKECEVIIHPTVKVRAPTTNYLSAPPASRCDVKM